MKKITLVLFMLVGFVTVSFAQKKGGGKKMDPTAMATKKTDQMKEELDLTDAQYAKIFALNEEQAKGIIEKRKSGGQPTEAEREEMKKANQAYRKSIKDILTPEQFEQYKDAAMERRNERGGDRSEKPAPRRNANK